jgi:hypothetical protein
VLRGADRTQCATAGAIAADTTSVEPATAAAIRVGLRASADEIGDGFWWRACAPGLADLDRDRGGFWCRAGGRDTAEPSFGRDDRAPVTRMLARRESCGQRRADAVRFRATELPAQVAVAHAGVLSDDYTAAQTGTATLKRHQR